MPVHISASQQYSIINWNVANPVASWCQWFGLHVNI